MEDTLPPPQHVKAGRNPLQGWSAFLVDMSSGVQLALLAGWPATCLCRQCCVSTKLRKDFPTAFFIVWQVF